MVSSSTQNNMTSTSAMSPREKHSFVETVMDKSKDAMSKGRELVHDVTKSVAEKQKDVQVQIQESTPNSPEGAQDAANRGICRAQEIGQDAETHVKNQAPDSAEEAKAQGQVFLNKIVNGSKNSLSKTREVIHEATKSVAEKEQDAQKQMQEAAPDKSKEIKDAMQSKAKDTAQSVKSTTTELEEQLHRNTPTLADVTDDTQHKTEAASCTAKSTMTDARDKIEENTSDTLDDAASKINDAVQDAKDIFKGNAPDSAEDAKQSAEAMALNAKHTCENVQDHIQDTITTSNAEGFVCDAKETAADAKQAIQENAPDSVRGAGEEVGRALDVGISKIKEVLTQAWKAAETKTAEVARAEQQNEQETFLGKTAEASSAGFANTKEMAQRAACAIEDFNAQHQQMKEDFNAQYQQMKEEMPKSAEDAGTVIGAKNDLGVEEVKEMAANLKKN